MTKAEIINGIKKYFKLQELVPEDVYKKYGDTSWDFLDERALHILLALRRDILKVPLIINDWCFGGKHQQRGLRTNMSDIVKSKTDKGQIDCGAHIFGMAWDLVSSKMSADDMRETIIKEQKKLPYPIRCEDRVSAPTWTHVDSRIGLNQKDKVYMFKG